LEDNLKNIAQKTLDDFFSLIEENHEDFEVDFEEEVLKFEKDDQIYILSFHEPTSQIWLSSPISGAHHFELKDKKNSKSWYSTRDIKLNLYDLILNEINKSNDS
tara:strand:+ start:1192 stop:1503 length:312 start_codon:yes stop_codon:yes gene_type:complete